MFALKKIKEVSIEKFVYCLSINGKTPFDEFFDSISKDANYRIQAGHIQSILTYIGKNQEDKIPRAKFKTLKRDKKDKCIDYEIKTKDLRVYLFLDKEHGKIVVIGGKKKDQTKDIAKLRSLKEKYFQERDTLKINNK